MRKSTFFKLFSLLIGVFWIGSTWAQVNISTGNTITQDFTIGTSATATMPTGWKVDKNTTVRLVGSYASAVTATERIGGNSLSTSAGNGIYNFGAGPEASATDRAVGGLSSSSASKSVNVYVHLQNNGGSTIENLSISYDVEKYRNGSNTAGFSIQMYYSTDGSTWSSAGSDFLTSFAADANNNGFATAPGATSSVTSKTLSQQIAQNGNLYLAWNYSVTSGTTTSNAQALGIDNVEITANGGGGNNPPSISNILQNPTSGITPSTTVSVSADVTDSDGTVAGVELRWGTAPGEYINAIDMSLSTGDTYVTDSDIPAQTAGTTVYYVIYALDDDVDESTSAEQSYTVISPEPSNHATGFSATTNSHSQITVTWTDATGAQLPHAYLVKAAVAPATPTAPTDGVAEGDGTLVKNIDFGEEEAIFTGLDPETTYNFAIWPYTNEGSSIDYKTNGTVPDASAETNPLPWLEDFETGTKASYAVGDATCTKGSWNLAEAVIGNLANDKKNGTQSARMRYSSESLFGIMTMNFDKTNGAGTVTVQHAKYGTDIDGSWKLQMSADAGSTWTDVGSTIYTTNTALAAQEFEVNHPGNVRFKIIQLSGNRINIDDIVISDYEVPTFTGTGAWTETARWSTGQVPGSSDEVLIHGSCSIAGAVTIGTVYIGSDYSLEVETTGALTINTKLVNNDALVIYSDASGTGSLIVNGAVSGSGKAYIERHLTKYDSPNDNKYHFISSPVTAQAIRPEFVANTPAEDEDFYFFDETQKLWINSKTIANVWNEDFEDQFTVGKGYMVAYPSNVTKLFTGTLNNNASYVLNCTHTAGQGNGWNLLGNPYQAAIDWDAVTLGDGMDNALYYWDSESQKYRYYIALEPFTNPNYPNLYITNGSQYIPPMQGFMVHAKSTGTKTVTIEKADLTHEAQTTFYKSGYNLVPGSLALTLISDSRRDEAFVHFTAGATEAFDGQYDAYKLLSGNASIPEIYTTNTGNVKFAINGLPELSEQTEVPVSIKAGQAGSFSISADLSNLMATAYLNDLKTGSIHNLSQNPVYTFTAAEGDAPNRFKLTFGSVGIETPAGKPIAAYYADGRLYFVNAEGEKTIEIFNMAGQRLIFANPTATEYPVNLTAGIYVVKVTTARQVVSTKFFVK